MSMGIPLYGIVQKADADAWTDGMGYVQTEQGKALYYTSTYPDLNPGEVVMVSLKRDGKRLWVEQLNPIMRGGEATD